MRLVAITSLEVIMILEAMTTSEGSDVDGHR
jgi:hypothetical protein